VNTNKINYDELKQALLLKSDNKSN